MPNNGNEITIFNQRHRLRKATMIQQPGHRPDIINVINTQMPGQKACKAKIAPQNSARWTIWRGLGTGMKPRHRSSLDSPCSFFSLFPNCTLHSQLEGRKIHASTGNLKTSCGMSFPATISPQTRMLPNLSSQITSNPKIRSSPEGRIINRRSAQNLFQGPISQLTQRSSPKGLACQQY